MADEATQGIDPDGSEKSLEGTHLILLWQGVNPDNNDMCGAGFDKPAVEIILPWTDVCGTPCGVISGMSSLAQGSKSLGSTADANVSLSYPPSEALQLVSILVVCILFVHHMFPSENCHIQVCLPLLTDLSQR